MHLMLCTKRRLKWEIKSELASIYIVVVWQETDDGFLDGSRLIIEGGRKIGRKMPLILFWFFGNWV